MWDMNESNALTVVSPQNLTEAKELSSTLAASRIIPEALQKSPADVLAIVMTGLELGLKPMAALRGLVIVKGKVTMSADTMHSIALASGVCEYVRCLETTAVRALFAAKRKGQPEMQLAFTMEDAKVAGLTGNATYAKFPAQMLRARALAGICRLVFPDVMLGLYETGEIQALDARPSPVQRVVSGLEQMRDGLEDRGNLDELRAKIAAAQTVDELKDLAKTLALLSPNEKEYLRAEFNARHEALK